MKSLLKKTIASLIFTTLPTWANLPYYPIQFPRDDAAHYANVPYPVGTMMEWWYYNGRIVTQDGRHLGYFLSYINLKVDVFGKKIMSPMFSIQITDIDNQRVYANSIFIPENKSQLSLEKLSISFDKNITLEKDVNGAYVLNGILPDRMHGAKISFSMHLTPTQQPLLIGKNGLIDMWNNTNSYYYSLTNLATSGYIQINDDKFIADTKQSLSWMDHQWGDFLISPLNQWMWNSIQLENGISINLGMSPDDKKQPKTSYANIIMPDGSHRYTTDVQVKATGPAGGYFTMEEVSIPEINLHVTLKSSAPGQDTDNMMEGIADAEGLYNGTPVKGFGYMESTVKY